ncbi:MAG: ABC transporter permease [Selenomonadaceae bacterium]|nr:ABC transporter permease [Selenomonadaceae bacterium]
MDSIRSELNFLFSGKGMPYEKVCLMIAMIITIVLSVLLGGNFAKDTPVVVIDLDNSLSSRQFINNMNASEYIKVTLIFNNAADPEIFFYRDDAAAVVYIPREFEKNVNTGTTAPIGVFYDNTNTALTADVKEILNEIVATENAKLAKSTASGGISLRDRNLFNPSGSTENAQTEGFLFFFGSMFFVFATIGMVPRLRMTGELNAILKTGTPWNLILRLVPYGIGLLTSFVVGMAILRVWGDMVFSGHLLSFLFIQFFYILSVGMLSLLFGWNAANPGIASSRMILFIPGGFILGGVTSPLTHLSPWVVTLSHIFPLTWEFHFVRDIVMRGASLADISKEVGAFFVYIGIIAIILVAKFYKDKREMCRKIMLNE